MNKLVAVLTALAFLGIASAAWGTMIPYPVHKTDEFKEFQANKAAILMFDEFDPPLPGWSFADKSAFGPMFHPDAFNADPMDPCMDGLSWWCGQFECSYAGGDGYGNGWTQWLLYENVDVSGYVPGGDCLILTFHFRFDSEINYDFTYVQAYDAGAGAWVSLNPGYDHRSGGWNDLGLYGFILEGPGCGGTANYIQTDGTVDVRFQFESDGAWSDSDGLYDSFGGAFNVDAVKIFEFFSGTTYLFECDQSVGVPGPAPVAAGNNWHLSQRPCITWASPPNSYVVDSDPDTTQLPGGLNNWLISPLIDLTGMASCSVSYCANMHYDYDSYTGVDQGASYGLYATFDDGGCWYNLAGYIGDFERHYGALACDALCFSKQDVTALMQSVPGRDFRYAISAETDPGGAFGCIAGNNCWWALIRFVVEADPPVAVEPTGWGDIKTMFQ